MDRRRGLSVMLVALACSALALCAEGEMRIFWRSLVLSWDLPATQAQDELRVQASLSTDPSREVQQAVVPDADDGHRHVAESRLNVSLSPASARLTRSPPSA
jgi:hypothetical protein